MSKKNEKKTSQPQVETQQETPAAQETAPAPETEKTDSAETLLDLLNKAEAKRDEYLSTAQRLQAEFDNFRRRNQGIYKDAFNDGVADTVLKMLPVLDNMERALNAQSGEAELRKGVEMICRQMSQALQAAGVEEIPAHGEAFDPTRHDAVMQEESQEESGTVTGVLQKGYKMGEKVLRPSMVKVAQ
ncbi:MAG: nucleotide exchange factor GrpE [Eubacteriales bacterium]|nr:nucleotide exchange factor GrpE [Eubacteriales bacterium]